MLGPPRPEVKLSRSVTAIFLPRFAPDRALGSGGFLLDRSFLPEHPRYADADDVQPNHWRRHDELVHHAAVRCDDGRGHEHDEACVLEVFYEKACSDDAKP